MRISKLLPMVCAAAFFAGLISVRADDNPAQAAARAALMEQMAAPDAQQAQTNNPTPAPAAATEQPAPAATTTAPAPETPPMAPAEPQPAPPAPATSEMTPPPAEAQPVPAAETPEATAPSGVTPVQTPEPAATMPAPATTSSDNEAQAAARAALLEKMNQNSQTGQDHPILINSSGVVPEPAVQPAPMISRPPTNSMVAPALSSQPDATKEAREKAEAAARAQAKAQAKQQAKAEKEAAKAAKHNPAISRPAVNNSGANMGLQPIEAPALPISSAKEMRLQALDAKYKADQISPQEYFKQREEILGEP